MIFGISLTAAQRTHRSDDASGLASVALVADDDVGGEIRLGSMLFTLVDPHRGHEVAYNRWYERDHFYAGCLVGPWLFAGRRWVATRELKDLRFGSALDVFGSADAGSYLAVYWILDGRHDDHVEWALRQVHWLHANGRMFAERDHVHTLLYRLARRPGDAGGGVPVELALDHPYGGLLAVLVESSGELDDDSLTSWLDGVDGVDLAVGWIPIPLPADAPVTQKGLEHLDRRQMLLAFTPGSPVDAWPSIRRAATDFDAASTGHVVWASPFIPTIPGTNAYTDDLW
jgi:hypothetical protein